MPWNVDNLLFFCNFGSCVFKLPNETLLWKLIRKTRNG